jgi:hypothetical protein
MKTVIIYDHKDITHLVHKDLKERGWNVINSEIAGDVIVRADVETKVSQDQNVYPQCPDNMKGTY